MKKESVIVFIIIALYICPIIQAQGLEEYKEKLDKVGETGELILDEDIRQEYLDKKWTEFSTNSSFVRFLNSSETNIKKLDPAWQIIFGSEFEWSFLFILIFILWLFFLVNFYKTFEIFTDSSTAKILFAGILVVGISAIGLTKILAETAIELINKLPNLTSQISAYTILLMALIFFTVYTHILENLIKKSKKEEKIKKSSKQSKQALTEIKRLKKEIRQKGIGGLSNEDKAMLKELREDKELEDLVRSEIEGMSDDEL